MDRCEEKPSFKFAPFLTRHKEAIVEAWVQKLHQWSGSQYSKRPLKELYETITEAYEADYNVLVNQDFRTMDQFIEKITRIRLAAGFPLSEVQNAFELFREILVPLLGNDLSKQMMIESLPPMNRCLAYTIHRFSDHFQELHEKTIREHNLQLERQVFVRTAELRESEKKYKTLVEEINDGYFVVQDEKIVFANRAFAEIHGCLTENIIGQSIYSFIAPESTHKIRSIYSKGVQNESTPKAFEYIRQTHDGQNFPTEIVARRADYENRPSFLGICRDITERVKMEQRVREAEKMAAIGQITTSLSHEIRNPLSAVKLNLQVLNDNLNLDGHDRRRLEISVQEVMRLERILLELLDFAKPLKLFQHDCDINRTLSSAVELLEPKFKQKNLTINCTFEPLLPSVQADGEKLSQAVINLLLNAFDASSAGGTVWVTSRFVFDEAGSFILVRIRDEGPGIGQETLERIFEPFYTTKTMGTGLGLTNVKRIVEAHKGRIEVSPADPHGALFDIWLPVGRMEEPAPTPNQAS